MEAHPFTTRIKIMNKQREAPYITAFIMSTFEPLQQKALHVVKPAYGGFSVGKEFKTTVCQSAVTHTVS